MIPLPKLPPYEPPAREPERAIHFARMVLPQNPRPVHPSDRLQVDVTEFTIPGLVPDREPLARAALTLPGPPRQPQSVAAGPGGLEVPWDHHPNMPALLIPRTQVDEVRWRDRWRVSHFISPCAVDLPFDRDALCQAAWHALARIPDAPAVIAELAYLASQVDALGHGSVRERAFLDQMRLPADIERRVRAEMGPGAPLLDARCLRWVVSELCAAWRHPRRVPPPALGPAAEEALGMLFPLLGRSGIPFRKEIYRAVWCLHDGFSLGPDGPGETDPDGLSMLTMCAAHSVGTRLFGDTDAHLFRAVEMWAIEDNDPAIAGRDVTPSAIRAEFEQQTGMTVQQFLGVALLASHELRARHRGADQETLATMQRVLQHIAPGRGPTFMRAIDAHLTQTPQELGRQILAEMQRYGISYEGRGSVPQHALETIRDRPLLKLPQAIVPLGHSLFLDRAAQLPGVIYAGRNGLSRRKVKGKIGHLFEARLQHRIERLRHRMWVATEQELDEVVELEDQRPDAVLRDAVGSTYLAIEIYSGRLETGVASGNMPKVKEVLETYLTKRGQADALAANAAELLGSLLGIDRVPVDAVVPLVVADEALPINPAFERAVQAQAPGSNPRFVCSVDEFELLLDLAEAGWDVAGLVRNWQARGQGQMLGAFLGSASHITPTGATLGDRFIAAFFDRDELNTAA